MSKPLRDFDTEFLKTYSIKDYPRPSLTADLVIFTLNEKSQLCVLMIERGTESFRGDSWAVPGGFMEINEDITETAVRELKEETNLENAHVFKNYQRKIPGTGIPLFPIDNYARVDRDERGRVVSSAYMAFVPLGQLQAVRAGDDAQDARLFRVVEVDEIHETVTLVNEEVGCRPSVGELKGEDDFVFDHDKEIFDAYEILLNMLETTDIAFNLLKNKDSFTIYEIKRIYENITGKKLTASNFSRAFTQKYVRTGKVVPTGEYSTEFSHRAAALFRKVDEVETKRIINLRGEKI